MKCTAGAFEFEAPSFPAKRKRKGFEQPSKLSGHYTDEWQVRIHKADSK